MENIIKAMLGVFISAMIVFSGLAVLDANVSMAAAETYLYTAGSEISAAGFAGEICEKKMAEANERNYELTIRVEQAGEGEAEHAVYAILTMTYPYEVPLLNLHAARSRQIVVY